MFITVLSSSPHYTRPGLYVSLTIARSHTRSCAATAAH